MTTTSSKLILAHDSVTEGLFKFRPYNTSDDIDRVKKLLSGQLYFAVCEQLNDPFEMRILLSPEPSDRLRLKGVLKGMLNVPGLKHLSPAKRLLRADQIASRLDKQPKVLKDAAIRHYARMRKECFLYCMSATRAHPLLWSHYADMHKGLCIQFDHSKVPFAGASKVEYSTQYPIVVYPFIDISDLTQKGILTKAQYWSYEQEYRLFSVRMDNESWHLGLEWPDPHTATVREGLVTGITLGARMPDDARDDLMNHCGKHHPEIIIEQAEISKDQFAIKFRSVRVDGS